MMYVTLRDTCVVASDGGEIGNSTLDLRAVPTPCSPLGVRGYASSMALATPMMFTPNDYAMMSALARASETAFCRASIRSSCSFS